MKTIIVNDEHELSQVVSKLIVEQVTMNPSSVLGLATGSSPVKTYEELIRLYQADQVTFKEVTTYNLDEYVGIDLDAVESYHHFMAVHLFDHIDIQKGNTHLPDTTLPVEVCCENYEKALLEHPIDLQLLGLGTNGHVGFNEPFVEFELGVHMIALSEQTRMDNQKYFKLPSQMPTHAVTMGIKNIMDAKKVVLIVNSEKKKAAYEALMSGVVTTEWPVTALIHHTDLTVVLVKSVIGK